MNCQQIRNEIKSRPYPSELSDGDAAHLGDCDLCRQWYADYSLDAVLDSYPVPQPDADFADRVIAQATHLHRVSSVTAPRIAVAASIAVISLVVGLILGQQNTTQTFEVAMLPQEDRIVDVVIDAAERRRGAVLTIALAESLELPGRPEQRTLTWATDLEHGKNLLQLPIRLLGAEDSYFTVRMVHGDTERLLRVDVRAQKPAEDGLSV